MLKNIENEALLEELRKKVPGPILGGMVGGEAKEKTCNKSLKLTGLSNGGG